MNLTQEVKTTLPRKGMQFHYPGDNTLTTEEVADLVLMLCNAMGLTVCTHQGKLIVFENP